MLLIGALLMACGQPIDDGDTADPGDPGDSESVPAALAAEATADPTAETEGPGIRLGILGECEGPFAAFHEDVVAGVALALAEQAGATLGSRTSALDGITGATVAGIPIEVVGIGCGNDSSARILAILQELVHEKGANVVIGPLSGDEGVATALFALDHPAVTFINGSAGAQDATLKVDAPNFFRFVADGAQWNAGLGHEVYENLGWRRVAVIGDDYGFGWTSTAGFAADFCGSGGRVTQSVFPALGTEDYKPYIAQLPDPEEVDGYFWAIGGTGTLPALEEFVRQKGAFVGTQHAGNLFFSPAIAGVVGPEAANGVRIGGSASLPADVTTPEITSYRALADNTWDTLPAGLAGGEAAPPSTALGFLFGYSYYVATTALVEALTAVDGVPGPDGAHLRDALATLELDLPYGAVSLDERRQAMAQTSISELRLTETGEVVQVTTALVPGVDQTLNGTFSPTSAAPERNNTPCELRFLPYNFRKIQVYLGVPRPLADS
ncbi:MAG: ABC transporter substrate-binding protein [Actinomycetota bacterium]